MQPTKIVVVGDNAVGKTTFILTFTTNTFPQSEYLPPPENYSANLVTDGNTVELAIHDSAGADEYDRLRPLLYPNTTVFMLCYAVDNGHSFDRIRGKWIPEVKHFCPDVPIVIVGLKADLRSDVSGEGGFVSFEDGETLGLACDCEFVECSAKMESGVNEAFEAAVRSALRGVVKRGTQKKRGECLLL